MSPYRVPAEPEIRLPQKVGLFRRLWSRVAARFGCHACRFVVGVDGGPLSEVRKGKYVEVREEIAGQVVESYYVCEICHCVWGRTEYP